MYLYQKRHTEEDIMAETKQKLLSVLKIMERTDAKTPLNAQDISDILANEYGMEGVERKSIYRDLAVLETAGFHVRQCDDKRNGWYMEHHSLDDWEIKLLMDSVLQASCISEKETDALNNKLLSMVSARGRQRFKKMLVPKNHNKIAPADTDALNNQIELLLESVFLGKRVNFKYIAYDSNLKPFYRHDEKIYDFSLYSLYYSKNTYYMIGSDSSHEGLSNFRLDRIRQLTLTDEPAVPATEVLGKNAEITLQSYIETRVDNYGGNKIQLTLECEPTDIAMLILKDFAGSEGDVSVGSRPTITHLPNGNIQVRLMKQNSPTLINWIMEYSNMFWVVGPEDVKAAVKERLTGALSHY